MQIKYNNNYSKCFVCGKENEKGLQLNFLYDENNKLTKTDVIFKTYMQGYEGIIHGGFISMLLDEIMAKSCLNAGYLAVTGRLNVKFIKPIAPDEEIRFYGKIDDIKGKVIKASAWCEDESSSRKSEAESTFIILSKVKTNV